MKSNPKAAASDKDKRLFIASVIFFLVTCALVVASAVNRNTGNNTDQRPAPVGTLDPQIVANLTRMPTISPTLQASLSQQVNQLKDMVDKCPTYDNERRSQMQQHIVWLLDPSQIPPDIMLALGANPIGRLIGGMSTYTSVEWRLQNRPANSCLVTIGQTLNGMLIAAGEQPVPEFGG